jgi:Skp family chaperone for outer membrane proteins
MRAHRPLVLLVLALAFGPATQAQTARSGGGGSAQLLQQMQQLASERTSLQAQNAKLKKDLEDLRKERDTLKNGQQALDKRVKASEAALRQSQTRQPQADPELAQTKEKLQQVVAKFRETLQTLKEVETAQATAKQTLATRDQELRVCVDHNKALYKLDDEVLTHLEKQTMWTRVAATEPFTRIKRTQLENYVVESRTKADEHVVPAPSDSTGTQSAPR